MNLFATESPVEGISTVTCESDDGTTSPMCVVDESIFNIPTNYSVIGKFYDSNHVIEAKASLNF